MNPPPSFLEAALTLVLAVDCSQEGIVPKLEQFQVIRVLGEGGFGQVIEERR